MKNLSILRLLVVVPCALPSVTNAQHFFRGSHVIDPNASCNVNGVDNIPVPLLDGTAFIVGSLENGRIFVNHVDSQGDLLESETYESNFGLFAKDAVVYGDKLIVAIKATTFAPMTDHPARLIIRATNLEEVVDFSYWFDEGVIPKIIVGGYSLLVERDFDQVELWDISGEDPETVFLSSGSVGYAVDNPEEGLFAFSTNTFAGVFDYSGISSVEVNYEYTSPNGLYTSNFTTPWGVGWSSDSIAEFYDVLYQGKRVTADVVSGIAHENDWSESGKHPRFAFKEQIRLGLLTNVPLGQNIDDGSSIWCGDSIYNVKSELPVDQLISWVTQMGHARLDQEGKFIWITGKMGGYGHDGNFQFFGKIPAEAYPLPNEPLVQTGIQGLQSNQVLEIYPNPSNGQFYFFGLCGNYDVKDSFGRALETISVTSSNGQEVDLRGLSSGVYTIGKNKGKIKKLVIQ